jgi:NADH-quinone oxidoreductase subunit N
MAAMAKIAGFVAIARILLTGFPRLSPVWLPVVAGVAALSMVVGAILALVQGDVRRMLAYSGVAHAGFILTGVVGGSTEGILFYVAVYALQLLGSFAVVAVVSGSAGSASALSDYRGLSSRSPLLAVSFSVLLLGMAGLPLTSGFIAKFNVFSGAWAGGYRWLVIVAVLASVVAFAFYLRVIVVMFMEDTQAEAIDVPNASRWALVAAVAATIGWGILPGTLLDIVSNAIPL